MSVLMIWVAALLPAVLLWLYIWKKDAQPEPTFWLVKAVIWGVVICMFVAILESVYHFVDRSPQTAACILLVPVLAHGLYDAIALSGSVDASIGGLGFFVLIWFCVKMHKVARLKIMMLVEKDMKRYILDLEDNEQKV